MGTHHHHLTFKVYFYTPVKVGTFYVSEEALTAAMHSWILTVIREDARRWQKYLETSIVDFWWEKYQKDYDAQSHIFLDALTKKSLPEIPSRIIVVFS